MQQIKSRVTNNGTIQYYLAQTGAVLNGIAAITLSDQPDAVFTVFQKDGQPVFHMPINGKMVLTSVHNAINKYGKTVLLVSSSVGTGGMQ